MRSAVVLLVYAGLALAQAKPESHTVTQEGRAKSRELLAAAEAAVGTADPAVQVAATLQIADAYRALAPAKAPELLHRAYDAAAVLPASGAGARRRNRFQVDAVRQMADLNLGAAREMLAAIPAADPQEYDPRVWAMVRIVELILQKGDFDTAIEAVNGLHGAYPFGAASLILAKLPAGDTRRITLFGDATAAYSARPDREFVHLISRHWRTVPRRMAEAALDSALKQTLEAKDDRTEMVTIATEEDTVTLRSAKDVDLFELLPVLRALEPARAQEILDSRRELKALLQTHPQGSQSIKGTSGSAIRVGGRRAGAPPPNIAQQAQTSAQLDLASQSVSKSAAAFAVLQKDPQQAMATARLIPLPARRAAVLGSIAAATASTDPTTARSALKDALALVPELKDPSGRTAAWDSIAGAAHALGDDKLTNEAIEKGMADAAEIYKKDADRDKPNPLPRHAWPSTEAFLQLVRRATRLFGAEAEPLLLQISDPDLNLLARVEMARVLVGR